MNTTRASLLNRIKDPRDTEAWAQFHDLYAPLIYRYERKRSPELGCRNLIDWSATWIRA